MQRVDDYHTTLITIHIVAQFPLISLCRILLAMKLSSPLLLLLKKMVQKFHIFLRHINRQSIDKIKHTRLLFVRHQHDNHTESLHLGQTQQVLRNVYAIAGNKHCGPYYKSMLLLLLLLLSLIS